MGIDFPKPKVKAVLTPAPGHSMTFGETSISSSGFIVGLTASCSCGWKGERRLHLSLKSAEAVRSGHESATRGELIDKLVDAHDQETCA